MFGEIERAAGAFDHGERERIAPAAAFIDRGLGAFLRRAQLAQYRRQRRLVVRDHRAGGGGGGSAHHAHQPTIEKGETTFADELAALGQGSPIDVFIGRHRTAVSMPQPLHAGQQIGHRQHGEHVIAAGVDHPAQVFFFDHMAHHGLRKIIERARNGQVAVGRDRAFLFAVSLDERLLGGVHVKTFLHLRVKTVAVGDCRARRLVAGEDRAHPITIHHDQGVVGFEFNFGVLVRVLGERLAHQPLRTLVGSTIIFDIARGFE